MNDSKPVLYKGNITAGSLKIRESRIIADLLIRNVTDQEWNKLFYDDNILQAKNPATVRRYVQLIRQRLELMNVDLWKLIRDGSSLVATHAALAAAVKHSRLLGDFMYLVVREYNRMFKPALTLATWNDFLDDCSGRDSRVETWSDLTRKKLNTVVYHILIQAGYLENNRTLKLQNVHVAPEVIQYLERNHEHYVLKCLEVSR
jgi:hypothetical protein